MSAPAQCIHLYLPGGEEAGVRRAHYPRNSKVVVCQVPREKLPHALKREELKRPGLYFLVAPTDLRSSQVLLLRRFMIGQVKVAAS